MSMSEDEIDFMEAEEEFCNEVINNFTEECLLSYYIENSAMLKPLYETLNEAEEILDKSPSASLILSCAVIETSIRDGILRPIVYGCIHQELAAEIIMETTLKQTGVDKLKKLLYKLLKNIADIDIDNFKIEESGKNLWEERCTAQKIRNKISHGARRCNSKDAKLSLSVAHCVLTKLIPKVLDSLKLVVNDNKEIAYKPNGKNIGFYRTSIVE